MKEEIKIINGGFHIDERGKISFFNDLSLEKIKRFYMVENSSINIIRAFQGHLKEAKYIYPITGSVMVIAVYIDDIKSHSKNNKINKYILSSNEQKILYIPPKYANGFRSLESNTKIIVFSTCSLDESIKDDYRFPYNYWGEKIWKINKDK